jgi:cation diffusion facilitator CzcD-associated flavoprotein CzcO/acetyl esterase/lipase
MVRSIVSWEATPEPYSPSAVSRHLPRPLVRLTARVFQRSWQRPWVPIRVQRALTVAGATLTIVPRGISIGHQRLGGRPCDRISAPGAVEGRAILYLHGGAYVVGSPRTHRAMGAQIAVAGGALAYLLDYRRGPEHKHPAALEDALAAYRELLDSGLDAGSIVVAGDSAGAGLAISLATRLRRAGEPMPAGLALLNGWFDLTLSGASTFANARRDAGLTRPWTLAGGELYRGGADPTDPELSPIRADLAGLPPIYLQVGTDDLLLNDSERLAERARAAGVDLAYRRFEGMWHDFQLGAPLLREAEEAFADLGGALQDLWAGRPLAARSASGDGSRNGRPGRPPRVAIVGAGFGGIGLGITLKRAGIESFEILEKADGIGGVWRDNTYPGLTCDIPSHLYSYSFEPNPDWSRTYSPQAEILAYLERCAERHRIGPHVRLRTEVARADFDEQRAIWRITTTAGEEIEADVLVSSCGQLSRPALTRIEGTERFAGPVFHSARWDHEAELAGKRVAVIGTGASTIQIVPSIVDRVAQLDVYQRSAPYVMPKKDRAYRPWEKRLFRVLPPVRLLHRLAQFLFYELGTAALIQFKSLGRLGRRAFERQLVQQVSDPELRRALTPADTFGCKRLLISSDYLATFERPNVELISQGVRELTPEAVIAEDGTERPTDVVVLSTGFETTHFLAPMEIHGQGGRELNEVWDGGAEAYLGMAVAGFPNLFIMYGPNTNQGSGSVITQLESQMRYILDAIETLQRRGGWMSVRPDVQAAFDREIQERLADTVWQTGCRSWYVDENGRNTNNWPGFTTEYRWRTRRLEPADYAFGAAGSNGEATSVR